MADAAVVEEGNSPAQNPLVSIGFQKNLQRAHKYLEAEPKALGITQIVFSVFQITCMAIFVEAGLQIVIEVLFLVCSLLVIVAGGVALTAQNLQLPTLKACFGMQIVACAASFTNIVLAFLKVVFSAQVCWYFAYTHDFEETCRKLETIEHHIFVECMVIQALLLAISATLAAYCYKVVKCCGSGQNMTVITLQGLAAQQREEP